MSRDIAVSVRMRLESSLAELLSDIEAAYRRASKSEPGDRRDTLAEEIARLPEKYRLPVQLCYGAGLTTTEAAGRLGWPRGTVLTRLAWARKHLHKCLTRRGVSVGGVAGLLGLSPRLTVDDALRPVVSETSELEQLALGQRILLCLVRSIEPGDRDLGDRCWRRSRECRCR